MGMFLNRGTGEFERVLASEIYVDKTDILAFFIKKINTEQSCICVSRPRRFGKSITANMIAAYFEKGSDSTKLFEGRKLSMIENGSFEWKKQMNLYNVIRIDLADIRARSKDADEALDFIETNILNELEETFPDSIKTGDGISDALSRITDKTKEKFIIIIDEWDCLFRDEKSNKKILERYVNLLRGLFKGNRAKEYLALAYITGILPIKRYNSESALNNFYEYTMLSPKNLAKYIGFSADEVRELCNRYEMDYEEAKEWYDGYSFEGAEHIYGPNSVVQAMLGRTYESYWSQTVAFNSLTTYISMNFDGLKDSIIQLIGGNRQPVKIRTYANDMVSFKRKDDVLTALIHLGYLAYDASKEEVFIPNREVRECFEAAIEDTDWNCLIQSIDESENLLEATIEMEEEEVAQAIEACHMNNVSILKYNDENSLSCVITLAYYTARKYYNIIRELPSGKGFADIVFLPKKGVDPSEKPAMIVELKWKQDADTAIRQIKDNRYVSGLGDYKGEVLLVGINYEKAKRGEGNKEHSCKIEKLIIR